VRQPMVVARHSQLMPKDHGSRQPALSFHLALAKRRLRPLLEELGKIGIRWEQSMVVLGIPAGNRLRIRLVRQMTSFPVGRTDPVQRVLVGGKRRIQHRTCSWESFGMGSSWKPLLVADWQAIRYLATTLCDRRENIVLDQKRWHVGLGRNHFAGRIRLVVAFGCKMGEVGEGTWIEGKEGRAWPGRR